MLNKCENFILIGKYYKAMRRTVGTNSEYLNGGDQAVLFVNVTLLNFCKPLSTTFKYNFKPIIITAIIARETIY